MSKYDKEFKQEAIRLCKAKDANRAEIARSLGVEYKTLCNWVYLSKEEIQKVKPITWQVLRQILKR